MSQDYDSVLAASVKQLGLTTKRINDEIRKSQEILSDSSLKKAVVRSKEKQYQEEKEFLQTVNVCAPFTTDVSEFLLVDFNEEKIKYIVNKKFYDFESLSALACALDSVFVSVEEYGSSVKLEYYLRNLMQIGKPSVEGVAMVSDLKDIKKAFVLKAPQKNPKSVHEGINENLLHEYVVGNTLNPLRRYIPNFAMIHGAIVGSPPIINDDAEVIDWGKYEEEKAVRYIVYENIAPGEDFSSFSRNCTFENWLNIYLQILYACHFAYKMVGFTHYDLHNENVIVRRTELPTPMFIPYETENGVEYMQCSLIGTVIDYGFSSIETPKGKFGVWDFMEFGVYPQHGHELHDAYKLLLMSMRTMKIAGNSSCFDKCREILKFFNDKEQGEAVISLQDSNYYSLPYSTEVKSATMLDLTKFIRTKFPVLATKFFTKPSSNKNIVSCVGNDLCSTRTEAIVEIAGTASPTNIFSFFDIYTSQSLAKTNITQESIVEDFRDLYPKEMKKFYEELKSIYENNLTKKIELISIARKEREFILENAPKLKQELYEILEELNKYLYLADLLDIARSVAKIYEDDNTLQDIYEIVRKANLWYENFSDYYLHIIETNINTATAFDLSGLDKRTKRLISNIVKLHQRIVNITYA